MANKAVRKTASSKKENPEETKVASYSTVKQTSSTKTNIWKSKKGYIFIVIAIILIFAALYFLRSYIVVATVNGQPISRIAFNGELEKEAGKQVMTTLIRKMLIQQEADKKHISVSQKEVNDR